MDQWLWIWKKAPWKFWLTSIGPWHVVCWVILYRCALLSRITMCIEGCLEVFSKWLTSCTVNSFGVNFNCSSVLVPRPCSLLSTPTSLRRILDLLWVDQEHNFKRHFCDKSRKVNWKFRATNRIKLWVEYSFSVLHSLAKRQVWSSLQIPQVSTPSLWDLRLGGPTSWGLPSYHLSSPLISTIQMHRTAQKSAKQKRRWPNKMAPID